MRQSLGCSGRLGTRGSRQSAFTLTEVMVSMTITLMVIAGVVASGLFCIRMMEITQSKVVTSDKARQTVRLLTADIHSAQSLRIGSGSVNSFTDAGINTAQKGNAVQIYPTTDTNVFIRYFRDAADKTLRRVTNGALTGVLIASSITNAQVFSAEDYAGNILTNGQANCVVAVALQFDQLTDPIVPIGPGKYYQSYQLRTKITQRAL